MATITEDYVSFETAKLLKEKGFDEPCYQYYMVTKTLHVTFHNRVHVEEEPFFNSNDKNGIYEESDKTLFDDICSAPSLSLACKWLREVHKISIEITSTGHFIDNDVEWECDIKAGRRLYFRHITNEKSFESCAEAAIKYCLENLI